MVGELGVPGESAPLVLMALGVGRLEEGASREERGVPVGSLMRMCATDVWGMRNALVVANGDMPTCDCDRYLNGIKFACNWENRGSYLPEQSQR